ncbi:MAG TPA: pyruvate dehydrogenase complex dihydrolipoamide acetyltransferase [Verrucomicrobiae bacterium]|nr:pyruvate dehydrogenase complex dihydrolipoamide acetyltransferase [Verrucomicrobiae bacterium]
MPIQILMPALSPTMTEGNLAKWLKKEGDKIKAGDVIAEIETDKATMEVEAVDEGTLGKIVVASGTQGVKVNELIGLILEEGESADALAGAAAKAAPKPAPTPAPSASAAKPAAAPASAPAAPASAAPAPAPAKGNGHDQGARIVASPLAKRMALQAGIDLGRITGSGPHGRIVKSDIDSALARGVPAAAPAGRPQAAPVAAAAVAGPTPHHVVPHSMMRKVIAKRLTESKQTVPHFYLTVDCEIDALLKGRAALNAAAPEKGEGAYKLSVNDFIIKAAAMTLKKVPAANASWSDDGTVMYDRVDVSVAVAIPGGLITPIIFDAANKGLVQISAEMKALAAKARDGKLVPEEYQGGTFSLSNLGMFGIKQFEAVINPPQGCILAIGAGEQRAVVKNGQLAVATVMSCTLSVDHRVVDGAVGAEYMAAFKKLIEEPLGMLL